MLSAHDDSATHPQLQDDGTMIHAPGVDSGASDALSRPAAWAGAISAISPRHQNPVTEPPNH